MFDPRSMAVTAGIGSTARGAYNLFGRGGSRTTLGPEGLKLSRIRWLMAGGANPELMTDLGLASEERIAEAGMPATPAVPGALGGAGREALGTELTTAAEDALSAEQSIINQQLAMALRDMDIQYGAAGTYSSGARLAKREEFQQAAGQDLSNAVARLGLQRAGLEQQTLASERTYNLQLAQLQAQKEAAEATMYGQIGAASMPIIIEKLLPMLGGLFGGGGAASGAASGASSQANLTSGWGDLYGSYSGNGMQQAQPQLATDWGRLYGSYAGAEPSQQLSTSGWGNPWRRDLF